MREPATSRLGRAADALTWIVGVAAATAVVLLFTLDGEAGAPAADAALGETIYAQHCATCHGAEGEGGTGPRLGTAATVRSPEPGPALAVVTGGRNGMPAFGLALTDAEIESVVAYLRATFGE